MTKLISIDNSNKNIIFSLKNRNKIKGDDAMSNWETKVKVKYRKKIEHNFNKHW